MVHQKAIKNAYEAMGVNFIPPIRTVQISMRLSNKAWKEALCTEKTFPSALRWKMFMPTALQSGILFFRSFSILDFSPIVVFL